MQERDAYLGESEHTWCGQRERERERGDGDGEMRGMRLMIRSMRASCHGKAR